MTTLVFLRSYLSRERFAEALAWVKSQKRRIYLPEEKLWVLDLEAAPTDPAFEYAIAEVEGIGWNIVGSTAWDIDLPLRGNEVAIRNLVNLAIEKGT